MAVPYLDSAALISSVRRRTSLPQGMFTDEEILNFANDEVMDSIVPAIKSVQEEYFVWNELCAIETGKYRYPIPERAVGNALRDLSLLDADGSLTEMTRLQRDDRYDAQHSSDATQYYIENSHVIIGTTTGTLNFTYLLRPNQLVLSERVGKIQVISDDYAAIVSTTIDGDKTTIVTDGNHFLSDGDSIVLSNIVSDTADSADEALINTSFSATVINSTTITIPLVDTDFTDPNFSGGLVDNNTTKLTLSQLPDNFDTLVDFLKTRSPHNTLGIDATILKSSSTNKTITVSDSDIPSDLVLGDTVASAHESDIPGLPTELHRFLLSKTCERVLESIGDQAGLAAASKKSQMAESYLGGIIDNRVTSAPLKIKTKNGLLGRGRRRYY